MATRKIIGLQWLRPENLLITIKTEFPFA